MEVRYYALYPDYSTVQFESVEKAVLDKPLLIVEQIMEVVPNLKYRNHHYSYTFFDSEGQRISEIHRGSWKAMNISVELEMYSRTKISSYICDPRGVLKRKYFGSLNRGIINMVKYLDAVNKYPNWETAEVYEENENLRKEIASLQGKIKLLQENNNMLSDELKG